VADVYSCFRNDAEEKPRQKRGVADIYFHFQSVEMRLKTQGHCHQAAYIFLLIYCTRIIVSVFVQYIKNSASALKLMLLCLNTLLKESVDWKNLHIYMVSLHEEEEPNGGKKGTRRRGPSLVRTPKGTYHW